jgi:hypothetical protein
MILGDGVSTCERRALSAYGTGISMHMNRNKGNADCTHASVLRSKTGQNQTMRVPVRYRNSLLESSLSLDVARLGTVVMTGYLVQNYFNNRNLLQ